MRNLSTGNMAASVGRDERLASGRMEYRETATVAIPPGLTFAEVEVWLKPYIPAGGRCGGILSYR